MGDLSSEACGLCIRLPFITELQLQVSVTKIIEAENKAEAQECVEQEGDTEWQLDYNVEFGHENEYSLEALED